MLSLLAPTVVAAVPAVITGPVAETLTDLALGRPAFASSRYDDLPLYDASLVTDGNSLTRWASKREPGGRSWIYVDLGDTYAVSRVKLNWEASHPSKFRVQLGDYAWDIPSDQSNWRDAAVVTDNATKHDLSVSGVGRYVRILCEASTVNTLYSLYDLQVYGAANLARGASAVSSSAHVPIGSNTFYAPNATDGNLATRWASDNEPGGKSWIYADLGGEVAVGKVRVWWEQSRASDFTVSVADDRADLSSASVWRTEAAIKGNTSNNSEIPLNDRARYVRVACDASTVNTLYSIWSLEVFGPAPGTTTTATPTTTQSTSTPAAPGVDLSAILPTMPTSDTWYGAIVNANNYVTSYMSYVPPDVKLMTDLTGTSADTWAVAVAAVQAQRPTMLIGTYHSSRDAQLANTMTRYPPRSVPREGLSDSQILMQEPGNPTYDIVDYRQQAARDYLVTNVVQDIVKTGMRLAYLDNVSHNESGFPIDWSVTTSVVKDMTTKLHAAGKRVVVNAAWVPGITSMASVDQLIATGVDGVSLEMGFQQNVRTDVARINTAMQQYRRMLDAGMTVIFIPLGDATGGANTIENIEIEQRLQAAFGMMFRKPGDKLFTNEIFWRPVPEWTKWPQTFGPALADATVTTNAQGQIIMTRRFANGTLTVNVPTKEVTFA